MTTLYTSSQSCWLATRATACRPTSVPPEPEGTLITPKSIYFPRASPDRCLHRAMPSGNRLIEGDQHALGGNRRIGPARRGYRIFWRGGGWSQGGGGGWSGVIAPVGEKLLFEHTKFSATRGGGGDHPYPPPPVSATVGLYYMLLPSWPVNICII